jgi:ribonuclease VapC
MKVFVDSSAIVSIIAQEPDFMELRERLQKYKQRRTSGLVIYESVLALQRLSGRKFEDVFALVQRFQNLHAFIDDLVPIDWGVAELALKAFEIYGKGRHPAKLNMGDCFSYACAKSIGASLLFKGNDFIHTDIRIA